MHAFVTGSTGLLGSNLVRLLVAQGHTVTALVRSRAKAARVLADLPITIVEGDVTNVDGFGATLAGVDIVFHTAAFFREYYTPGNHWAQLQAINVDAVVRILEESERRGVKRVIHTSSSGVLGARPDGTPSDESDPPSGIARSNRYFWSKALAEQEVARFVQRSELPVVQILPGWMFGPGDAAPTSSGQLILDFLNRKLPGLVPGYAAPVDSRDVAQAMIAAVTHGRNGERYIVGGDQFVRMADLLHMLERVSGVPAPRLPIPGPAALAFGWASEQYSRLTGRPVTASVEGVRTLLNMQRHSSAKAVRELGVTFRSLEETLRDEVAWFRTHMPERLAQSAARPARRTA